MKKLLEFVPKNWKEIVGWLVLTTATVLLSRLGLPSPGPVPPPPVPIWEEKFGWVPDPDAVQAVINLEPIQSFGQSDAGKSQDPIPGHVYLWDAVRKITPSGPPSKNQGSVGSCVSFGTNNAVYRTMAVQIAMMGAAEELRDIAEEVTYAGSRVEVGGGRIGGDGSVGAWAAKFVKEWGVIDRAKHGNYDLTSYDVNRCRTWGRSGVPDELEELARKHPVKSITLVKTWAEAKRALASGYAIAICSGQGFSMQRDSQGVAKPRGSWAHCMCLDGYHVVGNAEYGHIENSWGASAHSGPVGWGNPPPSGFWAESAVIERMLRAGDSWAFSAVQGFPSRKLDWFVLMSKEPRHVAEVKPSAIPVALKRESRESFILPLSVGLLPALRKAG